MSVMTHPRLKQFLRWELVAGEGVLLLAETERVFLRDPVFCDIMPLLDGMRSINEIFTELCERIPPDRVFVAINQLRRKGYLAGGAVDTRDGEAAFLERLGASADEARSRLSRLTATVSAHGGLDAAPLVDLLESMGVRASLVRGGTEQVSGDLHVALTDDYLRPELAEVNRASLAAERPFLLLKPVGIEPWLGPLVVPGRTGCWACLAHRLRGHRRIEAYLQWLKGTDEPFGASLSSLPSTRQIAMALAATEVVKWMLEGPEPALSGKVVTLNALTLEWREHLLTRRPQCPACGHPDQIDPRAPRPLVLERREKRFTTDGGFRAELPVDTLARLSRHVSPITGIIGALRSTAAAGEDVTITCIAEHAFAPLQSEPYGFHEGLTKRSGGKGAHRDQVQASAIGEAIERYSGVFQGDEPRFAAARADVGEAAIHPNACMLYGEQQYRERTASNASGSRTRWVPEPFDETRVIEWTPLWSLTSSASRYLPTSYCYYGAPGEGARFAVANSNGCAAGSTLEEAVLQGFLELVERDGVAIWWYNRLQRPGVDLASFDDAYIERLRAHYDALGRDLWAIDVTSDLGIPTFAAISRRRDAAEEGILLGFGAHLDARIALRRALTEVNQSLAAVPPPGDGAVPQRGVIPEAFRWWRAASVERQPYLRADGRLPAKRPSDYPALAGDDLLADVHRCVRIAAERGMETLVLDQTRRDVGLHVVRVVVPGLRHFWARFGPGRLYDVPVREGWLEAPLAEAELNSWVVYV
ncbi:TOMM precursor leader peptide-binding protein [Sorangium sp. So ce693]|uniref:TOMM precursor leader peptide-binding protein n=1 Tax=Sorangium sp. So ce693 TaxID=3133318 RepID=UPI003F5E7653